MTINHYQASKGTALLARFEQQTSLQAFQELKASGRLAEQEADYLTLLISRPDGLTDREAAKLLRLDCSTVSARRNGLMKKHIDFLEEQGLGSYQLIVTNGRRDNQTGKSAFVWTLNRYH